jgi:hypothetical protein
LRKHSLLRPASASVLVASWIASCAPALREPPPVSTMGHEAANGRSAAELTAEARASFAQRPDPEAVRRAELLYASAAQADPQGIDGLLGVVDVKAWRSEHEADKAERRELATSAVEAGQWCARRAPGSAACAYALAIALGLQAREHPATAKDGLKRMVELLRQAAAVEPSLDTGGPARLLALVLARAPAWPIGPGDAEEALAQARQAVALSPAYPPNQLALAETLMANGAREEGHAAAEQALASARQLEASGKPDAGDWVAEAERLLAGGKH